MVHYLSRQSKLSVEKKNPVRRVSCLRKALVASAWLSSFCDLRELIQALVNAWLMWHVIWIREKYVYNS